LLPLKSQHLALERLCESQRALYNAALKERIDCYRKTGKTPTYIDQCKALTQCRRDMPILRLGDRQGPQRQPEHSPRRD